MVYVLTRIVVKAPDINAKALGANITRLREEAGHGNQTKFAKSIGVPLTQLNGWEKGRYKRLRLDTLLLIAIHIPCAVGALLEGVSNAYQQAQRDVLDRQTTTEGRTVPPAPTSKGDEQHGGRRREPGKVIDLREQLKQQIANAQDHVAELHSVIDGLVAVATKPGVLERFDVVGRETSALRKHPRKNRG